MTIVTRGEVEFYIDERLRKDLDRVINMVKKRNEDYVWIVDGPERSGKSTFGRQIAKYLDIEFSNKDISFKPDGFSRSLREAKDGSCKLYDEAYTGLSSKSALSRVNKQLVSLLMEIGQKGLFIIIILPTFFDLDRYVALWRSRGLFHVYRKRSRKGQWEYYNGKKKLELYIKGKKTYSYKWPHVYYRGRFTQKPVTNEEEYQKMKKKALREREEVPIGSKYLDQRNILIKMMRDSGMSQAKIAEECSKQGFSISKQTISYILRGTGPQNDKNQEPKLIY